MLNLCRLTARAAPRQLARLAPRTAPATQHFHAGIPARKEETQPAETSKILLTPGTIVEKLGLHDWTRALPVGLILAIPALNQEWIVLSEETQLLGCFMLFVGTIYTKFGDSIGAALDAQADAILDARNKEEDASIEVIKETIAFHHARLASAGIMSDLIALERETMEKQAKLLTVKVPHDMRELTVAMLDTKAAAEANEWHAAQDALVKSAVDTVTEQVQSDKKLKKTALDEALLSLADPAKAPATDAVTGLFTQFFKDTSAQAQKEASQEKTVTPAERQALIDSIDAQTARFSNVEGIQEQAEAAKKLIPTKYKGSLAKEFLQAQAKAHGMAA
ncbi:hypothetical protein JKP88DRAFT_199568 [Tribonema minus]|uniref:ATP synthase subunit b n=1 Tax=Tribonema minus TaxID=303371 RepID=A0A836CD66_9STRA|nr:hypothetical protein JKP88DRAFT_199568 [Tribonema minus]